MWRLIINDPKGIWIFFFHSPSSMSWSSVRMRMMLGRMLRLSRWNRGFSLWLDRKMEAWATANTASSTKSRAAGPCVAMATNYDPLRAPAHTLCWFHLVTPVGKNKTQKWGMKFSSNKFYWFNFVSGSQPCGCDCMRFRRRDCIYAKF